MNYLAMIQSVRNLLGGSIMCLCLIGLTACPSPDGGSNSGGGNSGGGDSSPLAEFSVDKITIEVDKVAGKAVFKIKNGGNAELIWTATDNADWLTISPANGSVGSNAETDVTISIDVSKLKDGENTATITVNAKQGDTTLSGSPATIQVKARK